MLFYIFAIIACAILFIMVAQLLWQWVRVRRGAAALPGEPTELLPPEVIARWLGALDARVRMLYKKRLAPAGKIAAKHAISYARKNPIGRVARRAADTIQGRNSIRKTEHSSPFLKTITEHKERIRAEEQEKQKSARARRTPRRTATRKSPRRKTTGKPKTTPKESVAEPGETA